MTKAHVIGALVAFLFLIEHSSGDVAAKPISQAAQKKCNDAFQSCYFACPTSMVDRA